MVTNGNMVSGYVGDVRPKMVSDHVHQLTPQQQRIVAACDVPRSLSELLEGAGLKHRRYFSRKHMLPLVRAGIITMTNPERPRAVNQRYVLTEAGVSLRAARIAKGKADDRGGER